MTLVTGAGGRENCEVRLGYYGLRSFGQATDRHVVTVLRRYGLVHRRRRGRATGTALTRPTDRNALWCADFKGEVHARQSAVLLSRLRSPIPPLGICWRAQAWQRPLRDSR
jgi:hypothetical protein